MEAGYTTLHQNSPDAGNQGISPFRQNIEKDARDEIAELGT